MLRFKINVVDKASAVLAKFGQRLMTIVLGDDFTQPLPETFNGIEVRTVARKRENLKAKLLRISQDLLTAMIGSAIPNENDLKVRFTQPTCELLKKIQGGMPIAFTIFPEKTCAIGEVVGTKAIEACRKSWRRTGNPVGFLD